MARLHRVLNNDDIFPEYRGTPVEKLLEYHNLNRKHDIFDKAQLLIGMCIDNRENLHIPDNFAFVIRTAGANLQNSEFNVSFAITFGQLNYLALIAHNDCAMAHLSSHKDIFIKGITEKAGWKRDKAEKYFMNSVPKFEIGNEVDFLLNETNRLRLKYPKITIAPLLHSVNDGKLYLINEN
ncbi:MAG: hypothetical protein K8S00_02965 [Bacteroidales bacterium]|nr:hypothetical protein [Bacteroidales bacterium]